MLMFCHNFCLPCDKNPAKTGLTFFLIPRVNTRGYKYSAPPELIIMLLCADLQVWMFHLFIIFNVTDTSFY